MKHKQNYCLNFSQPFLKKKILKINNDCSNILSKQRSGVVSLNWKYNFRMKSLHSFIGHSLHKKCTEWNCSCWLYQNQEYNLIALRMNKPSSNSDTPSWHLRLDTCLLEWFTNCNRRWSVKLVFLKNDISQLYLTVKGSFSISAFSLLFWWILLNKSIRCFD